VIALAPGKIVLSGAYSVLEGAPAIVAAVDRYVRADSSREADIVTEEVSHAIQAGDIPRAAWFDASALRRALPDGGSQKLGIGSSAAILVATLAAFGAEALANDAARERLLARALHHHHAAQQGGSGIDVATSVLGGVLAIVRSKNHAGGLSIKPHALPEGTIVEVFASGVAASTRDFLRKVRDLRARDAAGYATLLSRASRGAEAAVAARETRHFTDALAAQFDALSDLGLAAAVPIVTPEARELAARARADDAVFGPSGAGGGDISVFVGRAPSSAAFREQARALGFELLDLAIGARGVHAPA
jgi:phosphomevalonate kinase